MRVRRRWALSVVGVLAVTGGGVGCGGDPGEPRGPAPDTPRVLGPGLGLGEWSDDGSGDRRVLRIADGDAAAEEPGDRTVVALVEICAPHDRPGLPAGSDWNLVLDDGGSAEAAGPPRPTTGGAPSLTSSGQIAPGRCAFADISFRVPAGSVTVGATFHTATSGGVRWSWEPEDTRT